MRLTLSPDHRPVTSGPVAPDLAATGPVPPSGPVLVWLVDLPASVIEGDLHLLGPDELRRAEGYTAAVHAARFVAGRAAVRRLLAARLGIDPGEVVLGRYICPQCGDPNHGPPRIAAPKCDLTFSLSRAGATAVVAIADGFPLGVDVETVRDIDIDLMAKHCLSPAETAYLGTLTGNDRLAAFHRCWCRKEAVTKASGVGIALDLRTVHTGPELEAPVRVIHRIGTGPAVWELHDLPLATDLTGAVAWPLGAASGLRLSAAPTATMDG